MNIPAKTWAIRLAILSQVSLGFIQKLRLQFSIECTQNGTNSTIDINDSGITMAITNLTLKGWPDWDLEDVVGGLYVRTMLLRISVLLLRWPKIMRTRTVTWKKRQQNQWLGDNFLLNLCILTAGFSFLEKFNRRREGERKLKGRETEVVREERNETNSELAL